MDRQVGDALGEVWERSGHRSSVPVELGCVTLLGVDVFTKLECLRTPCNWGFYGGFLMQHNQLLPSFPGPAPSLEDGMGGDEYSKLLIMAWSLC